MKQSTLAAMLPAIPDLRDVLEVLIRALPQFLKLIALIRRFRQEPVTPVRACAFENELAAIAREANRIIVEHEFNGIEPQRRDECPLRLRFAGEVYRRRPKSRKWVGSLFGEIELHRYLYQPVEPGEPALVPLEKQLGIEAGLATAALAERVGVLSVDHEQDQVRTLLQRQHNVCWSVHSLRKVTATLRDGLAPFREECKQTSCWNCWTKPWRRKASIRRRWQRVEMAFTCRFASRAITRAARRRYPSATGVANV